MGKKCNLTQVYLIQIYYVRDNKNPAKAAKAVGPNIIPSLALSSLGLSTVVRLETKTIIAIQRYPAYTPASFYS
jgi:hypothetical protein